MVIVNDDNPDGVWEDISLEDARANIHKMVDVFLNEHIESEDDGYADVAIDDLHALYSLVNALIRAKWSVDCSGCQVLEYIMVDRNKEYLPPYEGVPYSHKDFTGSFEAQLRNLNIATEDFNKVIQMAKRRNLSIKLDESEQSV